MRDCILIHSTVMKKKNFKKKYSQFDYLNHKDFHLSHIRNEVMLDKAVGILNYGLHKN